MPDGKKTANAVQVSRMRPGVCLRHSNVISTLPFVSGTITGGVITTDVGLVHGRRCNIVKLVMLIIMFYLREVHTLTRCFIRYTYLFHSLNLISNEPITFHQLSEFRHVDMVRLAY